MKDECPQRRIPWGKLQTYAFYFAKKKKRRKILTQRETERVVTSLTLVVKWRRISHWERLNNSRNGITSGWYTSDLEETRIPIPEARQRRHGPTPLRPTRRRRLRHTRQWPSLLRSLQFQTSHASCSRSRRQGRVTLSLT